MSDFDFEAAIVAARRRAADVTNDGTATRLRIRETLARGSRNGSRRTAILTALMATVFGSTAFAYYAGWRPPWSERAPAAAPPAAPEISSIEPRATRRPPRVPVPAPDSVPAPDVVPPAAEPLPTPKPRVVERVEVRAKSVVEVRAKSVVEVRTKPVVDVPVAAPPVVAPPPPAAPKPDPELAAYRVAHQAHVRGGDPSAALRAWDAYLSAFPDGTLAVDARYSRALILIKLKRWPDAAAALRPFAEAPTGSYRQADAAQLLRALPR